MGSASATVLVVRPRAQAAAWVRELAALGVAARALPLIEIVPVRDQAQVDEAFAEVESAAGEPLLVFVSPNAVLGFFQCVGSVRLVQARAVAWPAHLRAAATGPGTVAALRDCGVPAERIAAPPVDAAQFDSEALWSTISGWSWAARRVLIVRGNGGRDWLGQQLRDAGADVRVIQSYAREAPVLSAAERALLDAAVADPVRWIWMFSSSEAIDHLQALAPDAHWDAGRALASHPRIAERARALGFGSVTMVSPSAAAVAAALAETPGH
ncbi:MAG: uroporphyrinogen-III synthase [Burkholderiaceae bacterium]